MADIMPADLKQDDESAPLGLSRIVEMLDDGPAPAAAADPDVVVIGDDAHDLPKRAVMNADGSITLPLLFPVVLRWRRPGGEITIDELSELVLHRLTGADMRAIAATSREATSAVAIARSARMNDAKMARIYDRMDAEDTAAAEQVVGFFLGSGKKTGR